MPGVGPEKPSLTVRPPPDVTPRLTAGGYVFPVYGPSSFGDTFGAPRGDIASGWHHGEDIFGQLGAPLLAVADGTVFSVGWNDIGGYRLWLRDHAGQRVLLRAPLRVLAVRGQRQPGQGGHGARLHGQHGRRVERRRTTSTSRSTRSACSTSATTAPSTRTSYLTAWQHLAGHRLRAGRRLGAAHLRDEQRPEAGRDPALVDGHLNRRRPRPSSLRRALKQPGKSDGG